MADFTARVLLIGADQPTLAAARRLGLDCLVMVSAANRDFGLVEVPPEFARMVVRDTADVEELLSALLRDSGSGIPFDAVYTIEETSLVAAGLLAAHIGARGPDPGTMVAYRDKSEQQRRVAAALLPTPTARTIVDLREAPVADLAFGPEGSIVKPLAGCATEYTRRLYDHTQWTQLRDELIADSEAPLNYIVEPYIDGDEWQVDGVVRDGEVVFAALGRYAMPCLDAVTSRSPVQTYRPDPITAPEIHDIAIPFAQRCVSALGAFDGAFHLEFFQSENGLVFGECAARRGAGSVQQEVLHKWGVDLALESLKAALGRREPVVANLNPRAVGSTDLPYPDGILLRVPDVAELETLPGVDQAWLEVPPGMSMPPHVNTVYRLGSAVMSAPDERVLQDRMDSAVRWTATRTVAVPPSARTVDLRTLGSTDSSHGR